jgi:hypothetical protein
MIEKNQLQLEPSRLDDLGRAGNDLHPLLCRGKTGREEFGLSFLLDDAKTAGTEWDEPPIVTKSRDSDAGRLSRFENRLPFLDRHLCPVNG